MADTRLVYSGDGTTDTFSYGFTVIEGKENDFVKVYVDNVLKTRITHYNIVNSNSIVFTSGNIPANGISVVIERDSQPDTSLVNFNKTTHIKEDELDLSYEHNRNVCTELWWKIKDGLFAIGNVLNLGGKTLKDVGGANFTGALDMGGNSITNVNNVNNLTLVSGTNGQDGQDGVDGQDGSQGPAGPLSIVRTFNVTVSGGNFYIDSVQQSSLTLLKGHRYVFDQSDSSNSTHPLALSTTSDGTNNSGTAYTNGWTYSGTAGSSGAEASFVVPANAPNTLYYYCTNHSGMGGSITTEILQSGQDGTNGTNGTNGQDGQD